MTKIEWCDETWNPITGCTPISEGCQNCYAKRMANRLRGRFGYPEDEPFKITFHPDRLDQPYTWKKPRKIFVGSMGDLFHDDVSQQILRTILVLTLNLPRHTFLILTKRPKRMAYEIPELWDYRNAEGTISKNLWLGITAENQKCADERIPVLLQIPAAVRFVSVEPMLGPIELDHKYKKRWNDKVPGWEMSWMLQDVDWVIAGPETGPGARPCKPEWIENLYEQCQHAGVPFFDKRKTGWLAREFPK